MSVQINYNQKSFSKTSSNIVLFCNEKFDMNRLKKSLADSEFSYISDLLKTSDLSKNLFVFELSSKKKIVLVSIKKNTRK